MNRALEALLAAAVTEAVENDGVVSTDTAMKLAAEGYDLSALDRRIDRAMEIAARG